MKLITSKKKLLVEDFFKIRKTYLGNFEIKSVILCIPI